MRLVALGAALFFAAAAHALEIRPLAKAGIELGGETIVVAEFTNGDTDKIGAHDGFYIGGGAALIGEATNLELHFTAAYKFAVIEAGNGDIEWTRWPLEALAFYRWPRVRAGGGVIYHLSPHLDGDGAAGDINVRFKNALGALVQVDWRITDAIVLGARYTVLSYKAKDPAEPGARSNGWGIGFSMSF